MISNVYAFFEFRYHVRVNNPSGSMTSKGSPHWVVTKYIPKRVSLMSTILPFTDMGQQGKPTAPTQKSTTIPYTDVTKF